MLCEYYPANVGPAERGAAHDKHHAVQVPHGVLCQQCSAAAELTASWHARHIGAAAAALLTSEPMKACVSCTHTHPGMIVLCCDFQSTADCTLS